MSIVADTLKRLQARPTTRTPNVSEEPTIRPLFNQGEGIGRHLKASRMKFWVVGAGMIFGLAGLALSAFWIGLHLDFGLSTNTHARMDSSPPIRIALVPSEIHTTTQEISETVVAVEPEIAQPALPMSQAEEENALVTKIGSTNHSPVKDNSAVQTPTESPRIDSPSEPLTLRESSKHQDDSISEQLAMNNDNQIIAIESNIEEPPTLEDLPQKSTPATPGSEEEEPKIDNLVVMPLKEEFLHTDELVKAAKISTNSTHLPSTDTGQKGRRRAINVLDKTTGPLQPLQANRLHHAQRLIQGGEYEKAVTLLAPLFHDPPITWQPWFWMGTALLGKEDLEQADQFFLSGLARNDKIPQLWVQRALVAQLGGNYQLAIDELRHAESLEDDLPHIHLNMGYVYEQLGNDELARKSYEKFLMRSEGNPAFYSIRKKLFARVTHQTQTESSMAPSASSLLSP